MVVDKTDVPAAASDYSKMMTAGCVSWCGWTDGRTDGRTD